MINVYFYSMFVKAKRYGGSMYLKINPVDAKTLRIEDGETYEIGWMGKPEELKKKKKR